MKRINGALFADQSLKEYVPLASNTGIITTAIIKSTFPEYNVDMVTRFMTHFELCQAESRGIKWISETGVTTIVEMSESFQFFSLLMFSPDKADPNYLKLTHAVLEVIKKTHQDFFPHLEVVEVISCPHEASSDHSGGTNVELSLLKKAILEGNTHVIDTSGHKHASMEEWMKIEPCLPYLAGGEAIAGRCI